MRENQIYELEMTVTSQKNFASTLSRTWRTSVSAPNDLGFNRKIAYDVTHFAPGKVADRKLQFMLERYRANTNFWGYFEK